MAFFLGISIPKAMLKLPTFKTYQQARKVIIAPGNPTRPKGSSGKGGKINSGNRASIDGAKVVIKEAEKNKAIKEESSAENKSKASN